MTRRPPVPPAAPKRAAAPQTTMAPFLAVPNPEAQPDKYSPERLAETPLPGSPPPGLPFGGPSRPAPSSARTAPPSLPTGHPSAPVPERPTPRPVDRYSGPPTQAEPVPAGARDEVRSAPWSTGPAGVRVQQGRPASAALAAGLAAGVFPGQGMPHPSGPIYGDWTRPSRSSADSRDPDEDGFAAPPATTAIPERDTARGRRGSGRAGEVHEDHLSDDLDDDLSDDDYVEPVHARGAARSSGVMTDARGPLSEPGTGPSTQVRGGRAADRAVRQAVDVERRKELRRQGETMTARDYLDGKDDVDGRRFPKRMITTLVAVAVVALGVLGVYSFTSPQTQEMASGRTAPASAAAPPSGIAIATLPPLSIQPTAVEQAPSTPVRVPLTVLNATDVSGLAGRVAGMLRGAGWEAPATGAYTGGDVAVTTVFFTQGDETQRQAAVQLVDQFPQVTGPAPRFFEVPGQPTSGLVVVVTGEWQP